MKIAQLSYDNIVSHIYESDTLPNSHELTSFVDITGITPVPEEGWIYSDGLFSPPSDNTITLEECKLLKIKSVKIEADKRILIINPDWSAGNHAQKQRNALMRALKLARKEQKGNATAEEITELDALEAVGDAIDTVRDASDTVEAEIEALTTVEDVSNFDIENNPAWPA